MKARQVPRRSALPRRRRTTTGRPGRPAASPGVGRIGPPPPGKPNGAYLTAVARVRPGGSGEAWGGRRR